MLARGRRVLLTGGLGGIDQVAVRALREAGARVVVNDVLPVAAAGELLDLDAVTYVRGDGSSQDESGRILDATYRAFGHPTDVVLLAGRVHSAGLLEQSQPDIEAVFRTNVFAAMLTAQAAVRAWTDAGVAGNLVFVSSWVQAVPWPGIAPYAASKAALRSAARSFAREFAPMGIRANLLAPGIVDVGMAKLQWEAEPDYRARARLAVPLGYLQPAESVADALVFLCSDMSAYMTGSTLLVDGGASLYPLMPDELMPDELMPDRPDDQ